MTRGFRHIISLLAVLFCCVVKLNAQTYCTPSYTNGCSQSTAGGLGQTNDVIGSFSTTLGITNITNNNTGCSSQCTGNLTVWPAAQGLYLTVARGQNFRMTVAGEPTSASGTFQQGYTVWIDWNRNGVFAAAEQVWTVGPGFGPFISPLVTVPTSALCGPTRLRVRSQYMAQPNDPCANYTYGEAEDYTVYVVGNPQVNVPIVSDTSICRGQSITLHAGLPTATGTIEWFQGVSGNTPAFTGPDLVLNNLSADTVVYVQNSDFNCKSRRIPVRVRTGFARSNMLTRDTIEICYGDTALLVAKIDTFSNVSPGAKTFKTNISLPACQRNIPDDYPGHPGSLFYCYINVAGIYPQTLAPGLIEEVGIRINHASPRELDVWLVAPNGSMIDLTSDNGPTTGTAATGYGSGAAAASYTYCKFVPTATVPVITPTSVISSGTYRPEQAFTGLNGATNGIWKIRVGDDTPSSNIGQFLSGYIKFKLTPADSVTAWLPVYNLIDSLAQDSFTVRAFPTQDTLYKFRIYDVPGCVSTDSVRVIVNAQPNLTVASVPGLPVCIGTDIQLQAQGVDEAHWYSSLSPLTPSPLVTVIDSLTGSIDSVYSGIPLKVIGITAQGCRDTVDVNLLTYPVPSTPSITVSGPTTICAGGSVSLSSSSAPGYLWSTGDIGQTIVVTTSGTYWVRAVSADGCLSDTSDSVTVTIVPGISTPVITPSGPVSFCSGGSVTLAAPINPSYTYLWSNGETTQEISVNTSGVFSVTVFAPGGCSATSQNQIVQVFNLPATPIISVTGSATFCAGGSVQLSGPPAAHYNWLPGPFPDAPSITLTANNSVTLSVVDVNGCASPVSLPVNIIVNPLPAAPVISATGGISTVCQGNFVTLNGPSGFTYLWSNGSAAPSINVGSSGIFTLQVIDGNGCVSPASADFPVTVNPLPPQPVISFTTPSTVCDGATAVMEAPAGYTYLWSTGSTNQQISTLVAGSFTVIVTDANGCTSMPSAPASVTILTNPPAPSISAGGVLAFCEGGQVVLTPVGVSGTFTWLPGGIISQQLTVQQSGNYTVSVTDAFGCISPPSSPIQVTVHPTPPPPAITSSVPGICQGAFTSLYANTTASSYQWSNGSSQENIQVNIPGTYTLTITDGFGCVSPASNPLYLQLHALPPTPSIFATGPLGFCDGNNVTLSGPSGYLYDWSPGHQQTQQITVSTAGMFVLQVIDGNGCKSLASLPLVTQVYPNPPMPVISAMGPTSFCAGESVTLTCNALNVSYQWSNQASSQQIEVQNGGLYSAVVMNSYGCMSAPSLPILITTLPLPPPPDVSITGDLSICDGDSVTLTSSSSAHYAWSTGDTTQSITVRESGTYYLRVTDSNGCRSFSSADFSVNVLPLPPPPFISASGPVAFCIGNSVTLVSNYILGTSWSTGSQTQSITVQNSGEYFAVFTDSHGCVSDTSNRLTVDVATIPPMPSLVSSGSTAFCRGQTIKLWVDIPGTFSWNTGSQEDTITVSEAGLYQVQVMDVCSTYHQLNVNVQVYELPDIRIGVTDSIGCFPFTAHFQALGSGYSSLAWNLGNGQNSTQATPQALYTEPGTYQVSLSATSSQGCIKLAEQPKTISVFTKPTAQYLIPINPVKISDATVLFVDESLEAVKWKWLFGGVGSSNVQHPHFTFRDTGAYLVKLIVTNNKGCTDTTEQEVLVQGDLIIYLPNAFTPNKDNVNNTFAPMGTFISEEDYVFRIFDRWGQMVFYSNKPGEGWDGTYNEQDAATGTYQYHLQCRDLAGQISHRKGSLALIR